jgi:hypothetical protein
VGLLSLFIRILASRQGFHSSRRHPRLLGARLSGISHSKAASHAITGGFAFSPIRCRLGANIVWGSRTGSKPVRPRKHMPARGRPVRSISCSPQLSISKSHGRAANKSKTTQQQPVAFRCQRYSVACPKSFASAWIAVRKPRLAIASGHLWVYPDPRRCGNRAFPRISRTEKSLFNERASELGG